MKDFNTNNEPGFLKTIYLWEIMRGNAKKKSNEIYLKSIKFNLKKFK